MHKIMTYCILIINEVVDIHHLTLHHLTLHHLTPPHSTTSTTLHHTPPPPPPQKRGSNGTYITTQEFGYQLGLPWKTSRPSLPNNYDTDLESFERRLLKDPKLAEGYLKAINAYVEKGFARKLSVEERVKHGEQWLLPNYPVLFPHKPLPRVVFDSAAKHGDICLNDCLEAGPSLHNDVPGILMRFREKPVALTGDVSDMFCHVRLEPEDCVIY
jgi:hypothetical protein